MQSAMMKIKIIITLFLALVYSGQLFSQHAATPTGWQKVYIKDVGSFDMPPTMEIQEGKFKQWVNEFYKRMEYDVPQLVAQQKGLNEFTKEGFEKYARIMVETVYGEAGDFEKFDFNISKFSQVDVAELNSILKQQVQSSFLGTGLKLIEWYPLKIEKVNGVSCIHSTYMRQLRDNPYVLVHIYYFHNNDRMHSLTLSYRYSDENYWKESFARVLKSFSITNIR